MADADDTGRAAATLLELCQLAAGEVLGPIAKTLAPNATMMEPGLDLAVKTLIRAAQKNRGTVTDPQVKAAISYALVSIVADVYLRQGDSAAQWKTRSMPSIARARRSRSRMSPIRKRRSARPGWRWRW